MKREADVLMRGYVTREQWIDHFATNSMVGRVVLWCLSKIMLRRPIKGYNDPCSVEIRQARELTRQRRMAQRMLPAACPRACSGLPAATQPTAYCP